jgi:AcrR family transcriptional regulator
MGTDSKNEKYTALIKSARDLFWKHGFKRITVQDICHVAGVSKMTFYKFFDNKAELAKSVFSKEVEDGIEKFTRLIDEDIPVQEKIEKMILMKAEGTNNISREFMQDFYLGSEPELKAFVESKTREAWAGMLHNWKKAQEAGLFRNDLKPEFLLQVSFALVELMKDERLLSLYNSPQELILEFTKFIAYGISARS